MLVAVQLSVAGLYLPPCIQVCVGPIRKSEPTPDDHFAACPDSRVTVSGIGRVGRDWWLSSCPCWDRIFRRRSRESCHPRRSFHFRSTPPCDHRATGRVGEAGGSPTVRPGIVSPASVFTAKVWICACRPRRSFHYQPTLLCESFADGRVGGAGGCPTIRAGIVFPARVKQVDTIGPAPDDHFTAGPHRRVLEPCGGRIGSAGGCPTICAGIVPPTGVKHSPDIWLTYIRPRRSFHFRSILPCDRRGQQARLAVLVAVQLSVLGLYLPPVFRP